MTQRKTAKIAEQMRPGEYIRLCRKNAGMSQGAAAAKLDYKTAQHISNVEGGRAPIPDTWLKKLPKILGLDREHLIKLMVAEYDRLLRAL